MRLFEGVLKIQRQILLDHNAQHGDGGAAQREGVAGPVGPVADAEDGDQGVEALGEGDGDRHVFLRQSAAGLQGPVMLLNGARHALVFAIATGVVGAGDALHVGEFQHHLRDEIGLAQQSGPRCQLRQLRPRRRLGVGADALRQPPRQRADTPGAIAEGAQLVLEHHGVQCGHARFQALLPIPRVKKRGVGQARANYLFVAAHDLLRIAALDVAHRDEMRQQLALGVNQREILLMALHGRDQRLGGHVEKALVESADQSYRPLDQAGHFLQQGLVDKRRSLQSPRRASDLLAYRFPALLKIDHHARRAQGVDVGLGVFDKHCARRVKAMPAACIARLQAQYFAEIAVPTEQ